MGAAMDKCLAPPPLPPSAEPPSDEPPSAEPTSTEPPSTFLAGVPDQPPELRTRAGSTGLGKLLVPSLGGAGARAPSTVVEPVRH